MTDQDDKLGGDPFRDGDSEYPDPKGPDTWRDLFVARLNMSSGGVQKALIIMGCAMAAIVTLPVVLPTIVLLSPVALYVYWNTCLSSSVTS